MAWTIDELDSRLAANGDAVARRNRRLLATGGAFLAVALLLVNLVPTPIGRLGEALFLTWLVALAGFGAHVLLSSRRFHRTTAVRCPSCHNGLVSPIGGLALDEDPATPTRTLRCRRCREIVARDPLGGGGEVAG